MKLATIGIVLALGACGGQGRGDDAGAPSCVTFTNSYPAPTDGGVVECADLCARLDPEWYPTRGCGPDDGARFPSTCMLGGTTEAPMVTCQVALSQP